MVGLLLGHFVSTGKSEPTHDSPLEFDPVEFLQQTNPDGHDAVSSNRRLEPTPVFFVSDNNRQKEEEDKKKQKIDKKYTPCYLSPDANYSGSLRNLRTGYNFHQRVPRPQMAKTHSSRASQRGHGASGQHDTSMHRPTLPNAQKAGPGKHRSWLIGSTEASMKRIGMTSDESRSVEPHREGLSLSCRCIQGELMRDGLRS